MAPTAQEHARQRQLLLFQKLLNQREGASPLTLVLDTLEQPSGPIITEFALRAKKAAKAKIIYVTFGTLKRHPHADVHVSTRNKSLAAVRTELLRHYPPYDPKQKNPPQRALVILDALNPLATSAPDSLSAFLSNIITPATSLVAIYHADVPLVPPPHAHNEYAPHPLAVLTHLATAVLKLSALDQEIERHKARNRSVQEPEFGLAEGREGVLIGMRPQRRDSAGSGLVVDMEVRRRSGRGVTGKFVVSTPPAPERRKGALARFCLLEAHPAFAPEEEEEGGGAKEGDGPESTFDLGLTAKQRRDRDGVVLPYFDAQTDIGAGEGGRILYDMGREDDFDDEEDEI
ncbi:related to protein conferring sensitivity to killer toxin [Cephalotrichum gorgonifer]|uniref:Elongator complex protein 5 n=1 Tax=Cephalotrichum gorgonifer TaxID=2041049 RepID=A0AAE8MVC0_9PEZI|nr:related to protein conferring sensitivity to killer toxin [Cephalotrichum gorgonifer]